MPFLIWSGSFLVLSVGGSTVALARMIGVPIAPDLDIGVVALAAFVLASGIALAVLASRASVPTTTAEI